MKRHITESSAASSGPMRWLGLWRFALGLLAIVAVWVGYGLHVHRFVLTLGSTHEPTYDSLLLVAVVTSLGVPATYFCYRLLLPVFSARALERLRQGLQWGPGWRAPLGIILIGTVVPLALRFGLFHNVPWTDDEGSYQLEAELLASGRLWAPSPKMPVFFDNGFVVNNGKIYSQYFLGWPLLWSLGFLIKLPMLVNPLLSGLTAWLLGSIAERRFGVVWGRVAALLFLCSPFVQVSASTNMSHTSSMFALTLALFAADRGVSGDTRKRVPVLLALGACLAFWIRPATGLGFAAPLVVSWLFALPKRGARTALAQVGVFVLTAAGPGLLFLLANKEQNGSPWQTGYHAIVAYCAANGHRFSSFGPSEIDNSKFFFFFTHAAPEVILTKYVVVLVRLWSDSWGFPIGFGLALLASRSGLRLLLGPFVGMLIAHVPLRDAGIDTFGPVHYTELMVPLALASADGLRTVHRLGRQLGTPGVAPALLLASLACAVLYEGPRFNTLARLADDIARPRIAFEHAPLQSIVFYQQPFAPPCIARPATHYVFFRPNNDPDLRNPRLWANHVDLDSDRKLVASMPGKRGFIVRHDLIGCRTLLVPLDQASPSEFPPRTYLLPGDLGEVPRSAAPSR